MGDDFYFSLFFKTIMDNGAPAQPDAVITRERR